MLVINYSKWSAIRKISDAMYEGKSFKVCVAGWRKHTIKHALPLFLKYLYPCFQGKKKINSFVAIIYCPLFFINAGFWAMIITSLGYKMSIDYFFEEEALIVLFQKGDKKTYEEIIKEK